MTTFVDAYVTIFAPQNNINISIDKRPHLTKLSHLVHIV
jgi:hypothetical protein